MSEQQHSPEPWAVGGERKTVGIIWHNMPTVQDTNGLPILCGEHAALERAVACVNACAGIPTSQLEKFAATQRATEQLRQEVAELTGDYKTESTTAAELLRLLYGINCRVEILPQ
jgi:hypothetical protein